MPTLEASGTQSATVTTEHTLSTLTVNKTLYPVIDIDALVAGEYVEIKVKTKALSGGTSRTVKSGVFSWMDGDINPCVDLPPVVSDQEYILTLKQLTGTSRSFPWKIMSP
jgi:hypothetical protein